MNERLGRVARIVQRLLALLAGLLVILILAGSFFLYQAITGPNLQAIRRITAGLGTLIAGQRTEHMTLQVGVLAAAGEITGTATLRVRSLQEGRRLFYFFLNPGLRVRGARVLGSPAGTTASAYQLSLLTIIDSGTPAAKDALLEFVIEYVGQPDADLWKAGPGIVTADQVMLGVDSFWYPTDVQGFFTADVTVTAPANLTIVHNSAQATRVERGAAQEVRWVTERPVGGMSLVAGAYDLTSATEGDTTYRLYLERGIGLDAARVVGLIRSAHESLVTLYGPSGFHQVTTFVTRHIRRAFNDGSGVMGISIRYFRNGDYGFQILAHELAHNWWGATVAEKWLAPGTGGEWIVEGFAEFSSLVATETQYGQEALARRLATEFFDPARQTSIASMSVVDNALAESTARDTIYRKGAYVAAMLRRVLGDEVYFQALRQFLERYRYQQVSDSELETVLEEVSQQKLDQFFADWVRSDRLADLALEGTAPTEATVKNLGTAAIPGDIEVWKFKTAGGLPERSTVEVGEVVRLNADEAFAILDPLLTWADMQRENNRYPRQRDPVFVAAVDATHAAITVGEAFPWVRTTLSTVGGPSPRAWDFERGFTQSPTWASDGSRLVVGYSDPVAPLPVIFNLSAEGARQRLGTGLSPAPGPHGSAYAAVADRIVRYAADGTASTLVRREGFALDTPVASPDGTQIAYTAALGNALELRVVGDNGGGDRLVVPWDRDRVVLRWSPDGSRLYAVMGGSWDWQIWEVPLGFAPVRILVRGAATLGNMALAPSGQLLAFAAAPELDYPRNRRQLYLLDLSAQTTRTIDIPMADVSDLTWVDDDTLWVVASLTGPDAPWRLPQSRTVKQVRLSDGSVTDAK